MRPMRVRPLVTAPVRMPSARDIRPPANDNRPPERETRTSLVIGRSLLVLVSLAVTVLVLGWAGWLGHSVWNMLH